jgi:hypothetical protein
MRPGRALWLLVIPALMVASAMSGVPGEGAILSGWWRLLRWVIVLTGWCPAAFTAGSGGQPESKG